jgi:hypothetical protein
MSATSNAIPRPASRPWVHYINDDFFDRPDLDPGLERLAFRFERLAREKPWLMTGNEELMTQLGCSRNTLTELLKRGEQLGWFRRILITGRHGLATGRLGIVLFVRPSSRPVATPETFEQVVAQMRAALRPGKEQPHTLPFPSSAPQDLGDAVPKNWAPPLPQNWGPPIDKEKVTGKDTQKTTTMTRDSRTETPISIHASSGSSSSLTSIPRESVIPRTAVPGLSTAVHPPVETIALTPTVPARVLAPPAEGTDQALLTALTARVVRLSAGFKLGPNWTPEQARKAILGLVKFFGCPLWWIGNALDQAERRPRAKLGNKPVESWGFVRQIVANWTHGDGMPGSPPSAKPPSPPALPCPGPGSRDHPPSTSSPQPRGGSTEPALSELSTAELREQIAGLEATLASLASSPRLKLGEVLRSRLSEAQSLLAAREGGS